MRTGVFELEASVGIHEIAYVHPGDEVDLKTTIGDIAYQGTVNRINAKVDQQTQTIQVFIRVRGDDLKAGMYMSGKILADIYEDAIQIPRESVVNGGEIFIIQDSIARLREVDVIKLTEGNAVIKGIPDGTEMITEERNKAFEGTKVISSKETEN